MFTIPELAEAAGVTPRVLRFWIQAGSVHTSGYPGGQISAAESVVVVRMAHLIRVGMLRSPAEHLARSWADGLGAPLGGGLVVLALSSGDDEGAFVPEAHRAMLDAERASWARPIPVDGGGRS